MCHGYVYTFCERLMLVRLWSGRRVSVAKIWYNKLVNRWLFRRRMTFRMKEDSTANTEWNSNGECKQTRHDMNGMQASTLPVVFRTTSSVHFRKHPAGMSENLCNSMSARVMVYRQMRRLVVGDACESRKRAWWDNINVQHDGKHIQNIQYDNSYKNNSNDLQSLNTASWFLLGGLLSSSRWLFIRRWHIMHG